MSSRNTSFHTLPLGEVTPKSRLHHYREGVKPMGNKSEDLPRREALQHDPRGILDRGKNKDVVAKNHFFAT